MTTLPPEIDQLDSFQRARLAAKSLNPEKIACEVNDLNGPINDLLFGAGGLTVVMEEIEDGKHDLIAAAAFMAQRLEALASDLCSAQVELSNKIHFWVENLEPQP